MFYWIVSFYASFEKKIIINFIRFCNSIHLNFDLTLSMFDTSVQCFRTANICYNERKLLNYPTGWKQHSIYLWNKFTPQTKKQSSQSHRNENKRTISCRSNGIFWSNSYFESALKNRKCEQLDKHVQIVVHIWIIESETVERTSKSVPVQRI